MNLERSSGSSGKVKGRPTNNQLFLRRKGRHLIKVTLCQQHFNIEGLNE